MIGWVPAVLFASAFIVLLLVGLGRAPYEMFSELEVEEQKLKDQLTNRERRQAAMARLWQLRAEGENLPERRRGMDFNPLAALICTPVIGRAAFALAGYNPPRRGPEDDGRSSVLGVRAARPAAWGLCAVAHQDQSRQIYASSHAQRNYRRRGGAQAARRAGPQGRHRRVDTRRAERPLR